MATRSWFRVHSFAGVFAGLLLFVVCWSGTFATLSHEIDWLLDPAARAGRSDAPVRWQAAVDAAQRAHPGASLRWVTPTDRPGAATEVVLEKPGGGMQRVYVDPATLQVQGSRTYFNVQRFFRDLHMALFLPFSVGIYIVGALGAFLLASLVTPLVFYKRWWTRWLQFRAHTLRTLVSESHKLAGLWSLWFVLLIGVTGVYYAIEAAAIDVADAQWAYPPSPEWSGPVQPRQSLDALVASARALRPELDVRTVGVDGSGLVYVDGQAGDVLVRDRANKLFLDPVDGTLVAERRIGELGLLERWVETVDLLHFGTLGGLATKLLWFVFGLALSGLCLTGAWLHAQRLRGAGARHARWAGTWAASAVSLVVLAASGVSSIDVIRRFGTDAAGAAQWPATPAPVVAFLVGWTALTLAIVAAWLWWLHRRIPVDAPAPARPALAAR